jgi:hypothetical protein
MAYPAQCIEGMLEKDIGSFLNIAKRMQRGFGSQNR